MRRMEFLRAQHANQQLRDSHPLPWLPSPLPWSLLSWRNLTQSSPNFFKGTWTPRWLKMCLLLRLLLWVMM